MYCKYWISVCTLILLALGCKSEDLNMYNLEIDRTKLIEIMVDLTIAESALANFTGDSRDSVKDVYRLYIQDIHNVNMATVDSTLNALYQIPRLNREIQKEVLDSIKVLEEHAKKFK